VDYNRIHALIPETGLCNDPFAAAQGFDRGAITLLGNRHHIFDINQNHGCFKILDLTAQLELAITIRLSCSKQSVFERSNIYTVANGIFKVQKLHAIAGRATGIWQHPAVLL
jgi:hypothetical protein